jgi:dTDP-4-dehydrorhamnose 3,5-epimerase
MRAASPMIAGPLVFEPTAIEDERGFFLESWNARAFAAAGIADTFVQDNHSRSRKGVLRGLHYQQPNAQGKLVRVTAGGIFDVAVDLRGSSATCGQWVGAELTAANHRMLWVPPGFAHGFLALEDDTDVLYKCSAYYSPADEHTLLWNDPQIGIDWPLAAIGPVSLSKRDRAGVSFAEAVIFA